MSEWSRTATIDGRLVSLPDDWNNYWHDRAHHDLYRLTTQIARGMFGDARSAIDVAVFVAG